MKATFEHSVDVLVKAYLNGTLKHGNCHACAVGNLVSEACGYTYKQNPMHGFGMERYQDIIWSHKNRYYLTDNTQEQKSWHSVVKDGSDIEHPLCDEAANQIEKTGYSVDQLYRIEIAFETANRIDGPDEWMFNGLMAVVDCLADIHGINLEAKEEAKKLFVKV